MKKSLLFSEIPVGCLFRYQNPTYLLAIFLKIDENSCVSVYSELDFGFWNAGEEYVNGYLIEPSGFVGHRTFGPGLTLGRVFCLESKEIHKLACLEI